MSNQLILPVRQRIARLRWALPLAIGLAAVMYEIGPGRWIHDTYGAADYFGLDIVFYAVVAPAMTFLALTYINRWLDDKGRAEQQARASDERLASITAASADAILALDKTGRIQSWNRGAELMFGYPAARVIGKPLTRLLGGGEAAEVMLRWLLDEVRRAGSIRAYELMARDAAGREVNVELTMTDLAGAANPSLGLSVILRDVTDRKRRLAEIQRLNAGLSEQVAERTRELAEKVEQLACANAELHKLDQMRSEFVSLVSHQIRAPLTNIRGAVERMGADCSAVNLSCHRMFAVVNEQTQRLDTLVRDVLNAEHLEAGELVLHTEPISVLPVVRQVADQMRARSTHRPLHLPTKPGLPLVLADRDRLAEVLTNLLDNADKYSPPGAPVEVEVRADQVEVTLVVRDAGRGLPPASLEQVFEKFYRADNSDSQSVYGYGLGLYVCRRLIEAHGGHIWAENHPQGGAVFSFTLPVAQ
jgi:PAS domain S-box-containing protein